MFLASFKKSEEIKGSGGKMGLMKILKNLFTPSEEPVRPLTGRNEPCWCGSGIKYKKCHLAEDEKRVAKKNEAACSGHS